MCKYTDWANFGSSSTKSGEVSAKLGFRSCFEVDLIWPEIGRFGHASARDRSDPRSRSQDKRAQTGATHPLMTFLACSQSHSTKQSPVPSGRSARKLRPTGSPVMPKVLTNRSDALFMGSTSPAKTSTTI